MFFIFFLVSLIALWLCYFIGQIFFLLFKQKIGSNISNDYWRVCTKIFIGLISVVLLFSLYITKGVTINIFFIFIATLFLLLSKNKKNEAFKTNRTSSIELWILGRTTIVLFFFTALIYLLFNDFKNNLIATSISPDHYYYSYYASKMVQFGIEGTNFTLDTSTLDKSQFRFPYHYFDFWMIALLQKLSFYKIGLTQIYSFCFTPFILSIVWLGLVSVYNLFKLKLSYIDLVLVLFLTIYIAPTELHFADGMNLIHAPKTYCSVIVMSISFSYFISNQILKGFILLASLSIMNILALPVVCVSAGLYSLFFLYKRQTKDALFLLVSFFLFGLSILLFYILFGSFSSKLLINNFNFKELITGGFIYGIKIFGRLLFSLLPILLFGFFIKNKFFDIYKKYQQLIGISFLIIFVGYTISIVLWNILDSGQIRSYPANAIVGLLFVSIISILNNEYSFYPQKNNLKAAHLTTILFALFCFTSVILFNRKILSETFVSKKFIQEIENSIQHNSVYGYIYHPERNTTSLWANNPNLVLDNLNFLALVPTNFDKVSLSSFINTDLLPSKFKGLIPVINKSDFKRFSDSIHATDLGKAQAAFVIKNRIRYLVTSKRENLPIALDSFVNKIIEDSYSKKCFFILK